MKSEVGQVCKYLPKNVIRVTVEICSLRTSHLGVEGIGLRVALVFDLVFKGLYCLYLFRNGFL